MVKNRLTRHNGRYGKNGVYNSKHNDRRFPVENSEHIDTERTLFNIYWDCYNGVYHPGKEQEKMPSFEQVEEQFYEEHFRDYCEKQNARNEENRHADKNRSTYQILRNKQSITRFGNISTASPGTARNASATRCIISWVRILQICLSPA